ncbi:hypothetical protein Q3G72_033464 [Acer saccharum]|nr:hypothetical protein Q3G72_033464 [Acer saccharum]
MALSLPNTFLQIKPSAPLLSTKNVNCAAVRTKLRTRVVTCRKKDLHPEFYEDAKVYCNGELVMTTGGTKKEYVIDVWSGNHPFYLGGRSALVVDADQARLFSRRNENPALLKVERRSEKQAPTCFSEVDLALKLFCSGHLVEEISSENESLEMDGFYAM